jgi:hypothetical protein
LKLKLFCGFNEVATNKVANNKVANNKVAINSFTRRSAPVCSILAWPKRAAGVAPVPHPLFWKHQ